MYPYASIKHESQSWSSDATTGLSSQQSTPHYILLSRVIELDKREPQVTRTQPLTGQQIQPKTQ